jgi:hypothetical protein
MFEHIEQQSTVKAGSRKRLVIDRAKHNWRMAAAADAGIECRAPRRQIGGPIVGGAGVEVAGSVTGAGTNVDHLAFKTGAPTAQGPFSVMSRQEMAMPETRFELWPHGRAPAITPSLQQAVQQGLTRRRHEVTGAVL